MIEFVVGFGVFVLALCGLALGALAGRGPLRGSCGGDAALKSCPLCKGEDDR